MAAATLSALIHQLQQAAGTAAWQTVAAVDSDCRHYLDALASRPESVSDDTLSELALLQHTYRDALAALQQQQQELHLAMTNLTQGQRATHAYLRHSH